MRDAIRPPTLNDVLAHAQNGVCQLCGAGMVFPDDGSDEGATRDHVWPRSRYGRIGDVGMTLLVHRRCNLARGNQRPTEAYIRRMVHTYRRIPKWWLRMTIIDHRREVERTHAVRFRLLLLETLLGEPV